MELECGNAEFVEGGIHSTQSRADTQVTQRKWCWVSLQQHTYIGKDTEKISMALCEDDTQVHGAFHIKGRKEKEKKKVPGTLTLLVFFLASNIKAM